MGKEKTFRTNKHEELTLWNGSKALKFVRNVFVTEDSSDISFLKKKMKSDPHFKIMEVVPGQKVEVVDVEVMQQALIERQELEAKVAEANKKLSDRELEAEIKADNDKAEIEELRAKIEQLSKKREPSKKK